MKTGGAVDFEKQCDELLATNWKLREKMDSMVARGKYDREVKTVANLRKHNGKLHKTMISRTMYRREVVAGNNLRRQLKGRVTLVAYSKIVDKLAELRHKFDVMVDLESVNRTEPIRRENAELKFEKGRWAQERGRLHVDIGKANRAAKRAEDDAARLQATLDDYERAFADMARLHREGKMDDMYNVIPERIQLAVRKEYEPGEKISGSMDDVGLENEENET